MPALNLFSWKNEFKYFATLKLLEMIYPVCVHE